MLINVPGKMLPLGRKMTSEWKETLWQHEVEHLKKLLAQARSDYSKCADNVDALLDAIEKRRDVLRYRSPTPAERELFDLADSIKKEEKQNGS